MCARSVTRCDRHDTHCFIVMNPSSVRGTSTKTRRKRSFGTMRRRWHSRRFISKKTTVSSHTIECFVICVHNFRIWVSPYIDNNHIYIQNCFIQKNVYGKIMFFVVRSCIFQSRSSSLSICFKPFADAIFRSLAGVIRVKYTWDSTDWTYKS